MVHLRIILNYFKILIMFSKSKKQIIFLNRFIAHSVFTACTRTNYKIIPLNSLNKYLQYGTSETEVCGHNDVNNQQIQQLFRLLIFLIQPYMFRATNSPIFRSTFWLYIQLLLQCTDTAAGRCHGWDGMSVLVHIW